MKNRHQNLRKKLFKFTTMIVFGFGEWTYLQWLIQMGNILCLRKNSLWNLCVCLSPCTKYPNLSSFELIHASVQDWNRNLKKRILFVWIKIWSNPKILISTPKNSRLATTLCQPIHILIAVWNKSIPIQYRRQKATVMLQKLWKFALFCCILYFSIISRDPGVPVSIQLFEPSQIAKRTVH